MTVMLFKKIVQWVYKKACSLKRRYLITWIAICMIILMYHHHTNKKPLPKPPKRYNATFARETIDKTLEENLLIDKGTGCDIPKLDPFAPEMMAHVKEVEPIRCKGKDWVLCYMSKCSINLEILRTIKVESCTFRDILYKSDVERTLGPPTVLKPNEEYILERSDSVVVNCSGEKSFYFFAGPSWKGVATGFRRSVTLKPPPPNREKTINVLMLAFDSTAKNGFIRKMPMSYKVLKEEFKSTVLNSYNIVGDGTPQALFPMLTGKTELEMPDVRKSFYKDAFIDNKYFIFDKLKKDGYRTAYFEDMASVGTFQYRFNGFQHQPTDHYLYPFFKELLKVEEERTFCVGDTPTYAKLLSLTDQFSRHEGKRFSFTFISNICHDDFNTIGVADNATAEFLRGLKSQGRLKNTMVIVMADHGPRFDNIRRTLQGKLEKRLPLMTIRLPEVLKWRRPGIQKVLDSNAEVLTTPHDIYATLLDALDLTEYWNSYKIKGAELTRALSLFKPIPRTRSCSEAGIEPHWCACLKWEAVPANDPVYTKSAQALVNRINEFTEPVRNSCAIKSLTAIQWVMHRVNNTKVMEYQHVDDSDGYFGVFQNKHVKAPKTTLQVKITTQPGGGEYEASMAYKDGAFQISSSEISRTNAYADQPWCLYDKYPHLNMYCYCI